MTPPLEDCQITDMDVIVGGALAPVHTEVPKQSVSRPGPGFRLPSFHALGIAAPHPDRYGEGVLENQRVDGGAIPGMGREQRADSELLEAFESSQSLGSSAESEQAQTAARKGSDSIHTPIQRCVATLTPPAEGGEMDWQTVPTVAAGSMHSPLTDQGQTTSHTAHDDDTPTMTIPAPALIGEQEGAVTETVSKEEKPASKAWIGGAVQTLIHSMMTSPIQSNPLRILSHALPSPSADGHIFPDIIAAIHESTPVSPTIWINVFHAVPGRFNLADLPTSPPSTPGPAVGGEDYFTQKVFDSAVPITDYQGDLSTLPRSPRPAVPPSSINVSIVERYVPPTSTNEFQTMFESSGPSILVDRLIELSPNNGTLIFIYPTRAGAATFTQEYLAPILDPLLRSISVINGLSADLAMSLGRMSAAPSLPTFETMRRRLTTLCSELSNPQSTPANSHTHRFLHSSNNSSSSTYTLAHASPALVPLSRHVWAKDWWTKQEKPRVRDAITRSAREAAARRCGGVGGGSGAGANNGVGAVEAPAELVQQLLEGVCRRGYPRGSFGGDGGCGELEREEGSRGVEVGVFVVVRG